MSARCPACGEIADGEVLDLDEGYFFCCVECGEAAPSEDWEPIGDGDDEQDAEVVSADHSEEVNELSERLGIARERVAELVEQWYAMEAAGVWGISSKTHVGLAVVDGRTHAFESEVVRAHVNRQAFLDIAEFIEAQNAV